MLDDSDGRAISLRAAYRFDVYQRDLPCHRRETPASISGYQEVCARFGTQNQLLPIPQIALNECLLDSSDRIQFGAATLKALVQAGC